MWSDRESDYHFKGQQKLFRILVVAIIFSSTVHKR
jgi:hypothetical protein